MDPITVSALVAGGTSLIGGLLGHKGQSDANKANLQIAREQMQWNEDMWNKQNEYNTPAAQIQRMRQAGLNPALMYTQGNVGNAGEVRGYSTPSMQNTLAPIGAGIADIGDAMMRLEMLKQQRAQTEYMKAKAVKEVNSTMSPEDYLKMFNAKYHNYVNSANLASAKDQYQTLYNLYAPQLLYNEDRGGELQLNKVKAETSAIITRIALDQQKTKLSKAQTEQVLASTKYLNLKYDLLAKVGPEQYNKIVAEIANLASQGKLIDANADSVRRAIELKEEQFEFEKYLKTSQEVRNWIKFW